MRINDRQIRTVQSVSARMVIQKMGKSYINKAIRPLAKNPIDPVSKTARVYPESVWRRPIQSTNKIQMMNPAKIMFPSAVTLTGRNLNTAKLRLPGGF